jgi:hypothetical protein
MAFGHSSLRWFEACSCKPAPRGPPSSSAQLRTLYTKCARGALRRWYTNSGKITDIIKSSRQVKKISNWIIVKSSPPTDNSDMPTPTKTNFSGMKFSDPYSDIHPPLNSFLSGYKRGNSAKLPPCLPAQTKLTGIVAITKIIPNPFPYPSADRSF